MIFDGFDPIVRVLVLGPLAYLALVVLLRASGKRTLSKLNAFDLVVTVALGSTLATILLSADVSLVTGITALAVLVLLQLAITWTSVRVGWVRRLVRSTATPLLRDGRPLDGPLRAQRITRDELEQALRGEGVGDASTVWMVVLESDGSMSVLPDAPDTEGRGRAAGSTEGGPPPDLER